MLLTMKQASEILNCSVDQVRGLINRGDLAAIDISNGSQRRHRRIPQDAIADLIKARSIGGKVSRRQRQHNRPLKEWF